MFFATKNNTKVTAQRGGTALLPCTVVSQSSALVSWVRRQDFMLLTVDLETYISDERFLVEHLRHLGHWALRIKSVRTEDEGLYECQLSVHPVQSVFVELTVVGKCVHMFVFFCFSSRRKDIDEWLHNPGKDNPIEQK
ncbi:AGAP008734-PA-like protein [Anopheles sinensis]|uniref:AGAP008734-PA-like protein n=1 Tax=Anopheles sinensis TaxID=74873 RepID=A0A084VMK3_ANOSI|nr:AGAP008734-PA-like protein [Anopheles sinensis]